MKEHRLISVHRYSQITLPLTIPCPLHQSSSGYLPTYSLKSPTIPFLIHTARNHTNYQQTNKHNNHHVQSHYTLSHLAVTWIHRITSTPYNALTTNKAQHSTNCTHPIPSSTCHKHRFWLKRLSAIICHMVASHHLLSSNTATPLIWFNGSSRTWLNYSYDDSININKSGG